ncbi:MAG TPA: CBS domain-containing protein [Candidatus Faecousia intestinigallinarum]|nr:CBS domain-containing protein [Candidatus Faecousia intestinigallinarum]
MKIREVMTSPAIRVHPEESVSVAARTLTQYNIGALPVCGSDGRLKGVITDRDIVTRCLAAERRPGDTPVREVMTGGVVSVSPDMEASVAAHLMGRQQVRRLPVVENGRLCGMVSLADLAVREECAFDATDALSDIASNVSQR